jgi:polysaccharide pyruvyl transferase WcaK-like protein
MLKSITLLGSSSGRNAGDAALLSGIMDSVDKSCKARFLYEIPTIKPEFIRNNYNNRVHPISMLPWNASIKMLGFPTYQSIMRTDLSLVFDAILFDRSLYNPLFNFMSTLYLMLPRARKKGKRMAFFNVGAGPVNTAQGKGILRDLAEIMDFVTVRDQDSYEILKDIGVKSDRILLAADAALNVSPAEGERVERIFKELGLDPKQEILGVNINSYIDTWADPSRTSMGKEKFLAVYAAALNQVSKKLQVPLLFVSSQHQDVSITKELMSRVACPQGAALISNIDYNHHDFKGVLSRISLLFGMRLHAMILASSGLTPVIGLAYQPKCGYYFRTLELDDYIMSFADYAEQNLVELMLRGWEKRPAIKEKLLERIPMLQKEAYKAAELVAAMHREEPLEPLIARFRAEGKIM